MPEDIELKTETTTEEVKTPEETEVAETKLEEATIVKPKDDSTFEKHLYDCPMCHKKIKIHFEGCGCPRTNNIFEYTLRMFSK